jgi:hypothetical protein
MAVTSASNMPVQLSVIGVVGIPVCITQEPPLRCDLECCLLLGILCEDRIPDCGKIFDR